MTIVLDTSAIRAVTLGEPDAEGFAATLVANAGDFLLGAPTYLDDGIVIRRRAGWPRAGRAAKRRHTAQCPRWPRPWPRR